MSRFVILATIRRGVLATPEPLDEASQQLAAQQRAIDDSHEAEAERRRAYHYRQTASIQVERDPPLSPDYDHSLSPGTVKRMMRLAERSVA